MADNSNQQQQQLSLRWNNHTNTILQVFLEQYTAEWMVDVTLSCQGKFLKAHKMVVAACSPYFKELFNHHDTPHPIIILNGIKYDDIKAIIEFMYCGEIKVQESELESLLELAETLQIKGLCHVRKKYEAEEGDPLESKSEVTEEVLEQAMEEEAAEPVPSSRPTRAAVVRVRVNDFISNEEDDLSSMIKVEPPDIRDIDDDSPEDWATPRLVIDLPEITPVSRTESTNSNFMHSPPSEESALSGQQYAGGMGSQRVEISLPGIESSKIPRPPNAFMVFANEWRRKLAFQHPSENNKEISVRLGVMWKSLSAEAKEGYYAASREADMEHKRKYPGYYYSPKEARLRKRLKQKGSSKTDLQAMQLVRVLMDDQTQAKTT